MWRIPHPEKIQDVRRPSSRPLIWGVPWLLLIPQACTDSGPMDSGKVPILWDLPACDFTQTFLADGGVGLDGIPAISNPILVDRNQVPDQVAYLQDHHRVIGIVVDGQPMAFPLSALWHHEVVNLDYGQTRLVVTHGTLGGTSRVFTRSSVGGAQFGVSGLLYQNNVLLYDRNTRPSLWLQINGAGRCGPRSGEDVSPYPFLEVTWAGWQALYPNTVVLSTESAETPYPLWGIYPYGDYETSPDLFFKEAMPPLDDRRPTKERVLAIGEEDQGGLAFPSGLFPAGTGTVAAHGEVAGERVVVLWEGDLEGGAAYWAEVDGTPLTFTTRDGKVVDEESGTTWSLLGLGYDGPLAGAQLQPVAEATVAYWGVWAAFYPETRIWGGE